MKAILALICLSAVASQVEAAGPEVLVGPVTNPATGHDYYLLDDSTWTAAQAKARELHGHQATVNDPAENTWLVSTFGSYDGVPRHLWLGLNDSIQEGTWHWVNGETFLLEYWAPGEPNNATAPAGGEHWALLLGADGLHLTGKAGEWNDVPDDPGYAVYGIVEVAPLPPVILGPIANPSNGHFYYLLADSNWTDAEAEAVRLGGHVATM